MKILTKNSLSISILGLAMSMTPCVVHGATFSVEFQPGNAVKLDPFYNQLDSEGNYLSGDGNSSIFEGTVIEGNVTAALSARYYDSDACAPGHNGLLNSDLPWNRKDEDVPEPGWLVRFGLASDQVGSLTHTHEALDDTHEIAIVPASYLSFQLHTEDPTMFGGITLCMEDIYGAGPNTIWAATSSDGFSTANVGVISFTSAEGYTMKWDWANLGVTGQDLEVRVYGFIGADEGTFGTTLLTGNPPPLPEPDTTLLIGGVALCLVHGRKRRYSAKG